MWAQYAAGAGTRADVSAQGWRQQLLQPHAVSVASALWDVARLWGHERGQVAAVEREAAGGGAAVPRGELSRALLDGWVANFSQVVRYSQAVLPQVRSATCSVFRVERMGACGGRAMYVRRWRVRLADSYHTHHADPTRTHGRRACG
jgi:hypothetical protein